MTTTTQLRQAQLRQALGKIGIWMPHMAALGLDPAQYGRRIEAAGFRSVWFPGVNDAAVLDALEPILAATSTLYVGTGIASVWTWDPADLAARADRLAAAYGDRFILGLGNSHAPLVEASGQAYSRPYTKTVQFLDGLPPVQAPLVLAALGPKMLELARERTLGAHPYFVPPEHTAFSRSAIGPDALLIPEIAVALTPGVAGEAAARAYATMYLGLPNYTSNLRRLGYADADIADGGSARLMSDVVPNGPADAVARITAHLDAGADHVLVQLLGADGKFASADLEELASLVSGLLP